MSVTGNLPEQTASPPAQQFFNNFYNVHGSFSPEVNDAVLGYFETVTGSVDAGRYLASAVIATALTQNLDPMTVVSQLKSLSDINKSKQTQYYPGTTDPAAEDTNVYNPETETWSAGKQYARPGPSAQRSGINELDAYLTMFLNLNRVSTSLLGLNNSPKSSPYVTRMILP
jgi:hypothetical protein